MLRVFLALLSAATGLAGGLYFSAKLKQRVRCLSELVLLLSEISSMMRFRREKPPDIIRQLSLHGRSFACEVEQKYSGGDIGTAWRAAAEELTELLPDERRIIIETGTALGGSNLEGQLAMLHMSIEELKQRLETATEESVRKGRAYRSAGFFLGVGLAVMIV